MTLPGGYPNLLAQDDPGRVSKSHGGNGERFIKAKRHYDPDNVFCSTIALPLNERQLPEYVDARVFKDAWDTP